jgi:hypothetical protein
MMTRTEWAKFVLETGKEMDAKSSFPSQDFLVEVHTPSTDEQMIRELKKGSQDYPGKWGFYHTLQGKFIRVVYYRNKLN